jgi:uncharacterized protein (TIGR02145 family)
MKKFLFLFIASITLQVQAQITLPTFQAVQYNNSTPSNNSSPLSTVTIIGSQIWTDRNLEVSVYRDGTVIPQVTDAAAWAGLTTGAWCYYDNDPANGATYGKLYNWYAVNDPRGLAPMGYHIPSDTEWTTLSEGLINAGAAAALKEAGTSHWAFYDNPNFIISTNSTGFTALPGGYRAGGNGAFVSIGTVGGFWSSTAIDGSTTAKRRSFFHDSSDITPITSLKLGGFSVRLIKD